MTYIPTAEYKHDRVIMFQFVDDLEDLHAEQLLNRINNYYKPAIDTVQYQHKLLSIRASNITTYDILSMLKVITAWIQRMDYDVQSANLHGLF